MATKVRTPYIGNFSFPHACVACGNPPNPGMNWKVSGSKSSRNRKRTTFLSLEFPLCQECYTVSRNRRSANLLPWLIVPLSIVGICGLASQMSRAFGNLAAMVLSGILFIAVVLLLIWLGEKINQQGFTPEQRERRKRVQQCATISSFQEPSRSEKFGSIVFKFENPGFAIGFSMMNLGEIVTPGRQDSSGKRSLSSTIMVILAACVLGGTFYLADMYKDSPEAFAKFFAGLYKNTPESSATATPADTPMLVATPWTYDLQPFQAHITEYLDPEWTSTAPEYPYIQEGSIKGGLVIVSADTGQVINPLNGNEDPYNTEEPGPPDWGLPFAKTPEAVGTVVIVWADKHVDATWADGGKDYGEDWYIKVIDLEARTVVYTHRFVHRDLARTKYGTGDRYAAPPWYQMVRDLRTLLVQTTPAPSEGQTVVVQDTPAPGEGQVSQFATGATASSQYSETGWSALQAVGAPDTAGCGDIRSAWASLHSGTEDWLLLRYDQPVIPIRIVIYQTYHPGAVSRVEVMDEAGNPITVYEADPTIISQCPQMLEIGVTGVNGLVRSVRVTIDQSIHNDWSEIDAVQLFGKPE